MPGISPFFKSNNTRTVAASLSGIAIGFAAVWAEAPDAVVLADPEGKIVYANAAYYTLYGIEEDYTEERYFVTLFPSTSPWRALEQYRELFQGEETQQVQESRIVWADGCERVIETAWHFMHQLGERIALVAVIRDITGKRIFQERRQLEHALVESERKFRAVFNQTFQFTGLLRPDGLLLEANQTALNFSGVTQTDIANKPFWEAPWWKPAPDIRQKLRSMVELAAGGQLVRDEFAWMSAHHTTITVDFSLTPAKDDRGQVTLLIAEARNITERKEMETDLRESEEKYKALFQIFPVGIILTDHLGNITDVNPASERILGMSRSEQLQTSILDASWRAMDEQGVTIPAKDFPASQALRTGKIVQREEMGVMKPDGSVVWLNVTATPIPLRNYGVAIAYVDITQSKQQHETIRASEARYRLLFENTRYGLLRTTLDTQVLEVNTEVCRLFGYTEPEMLALPPAHLLSHWPQMVETMHRQGEFRGECTLLTRAGAPFRAEITVKPLAYEHHQTEACITIRPV